eukprot:PhM_4_TR17926/c0_g1_i1/m.68775
MVHVLPDDAFAQKFPQDSNYAVSVNGVRVEGGDLAGWSSRRHGVRMGVPSFRLWTLCLECCCQATYVMACLDSRVAVVVDPIRDIDDVVHILEQHGLTLQAVLLTHAFEDVVMGHTALRHRYPNCVVVQHHTLPSSLTLPIGREVFIRAMHTPGHTGDSVSYIVCTAHDESPWIAFAGDLILAEGYGRLDIEPEGTAGDNVRAFKESVERLFSVLPKNVEILCSHCGYTTVSHNARETFFGTTVNYAKGYLYQRGNLPEEGGPDKQHALHSGSPLPSACRTIRSHNLAGTTPMPKNGPSEVALVRHADDVVSLLNSTPHIILDCREQRDVAVSYVPRSVCIPMPLVETGPTATRKFEPWLPQVFSFEELDAAQGLVVVCTPAQSVVVQRRLSRVGFDTYLRAIVVMEESGRPDIKEKYPGLPLTNIPRTYDTSDVDVALRRCLVLDCRTHGENYGAAAHGSMHVPVESVKSWLGTFFGSKVTRSVVPPTAVYCARGYRSFIVCTILKSMLGTEYETYDVPGGALQIFTHFPERWAIETRDVRCSA